MGQASADSTSPRLSGREAAIARRQALSKFGKQGIAAQVCASEARLAARKKAETAAAQSPIPAAAPVASSSPEACQDSMMETPMARIETAQTVYFPEPISAARQRRIEQSKNGRGDAPACRPCGRTRPEPQKVETGTTLSGSTVTGNQIERTEQVTGNESGSCRAITGTEYIGAEQYGQFCETLPEPAPAKVGASSTSRGGRITGTELARGNKVTGDQSGTCKRVTGSEYLAVEQTIEACGVTPEPRPEKAAMGMTARKNPISGSDLARTTMVTGGESGAGRAISGSAYLDAGPLRRPQADAPKKVETRHTSAGSPVSGTLLGRSQKVSGDEAGACKQVTGSDYLSAEEFTSFCRSEPYQSPAKVGVSRTLKGQDVSGSQVGRSTKVTGDEYGACKPLTGTSYIGADQYAEFCASRDAAEAINRARLPNNPAPNQGDAPRNPSCGCMATTHHRARGQQGDTPSPGLTGNALDAPGQRQAGNFSITSPARSAQASEAQRITGSAYGGGGGITGSMARATGLVSGTPEFRYRDAAPSLVVVAPADAEPMPARMSKEGRSGRVTGDNWDRGDRITGTEGHSATRRNPTQRGEARGNVMSARAPRESEQPALVPSKVTGSSGSSKAGAAVTLSGGARG